MNNNVEKIIDQFDMYLRRGVYNDWKTNDRFLKFLLDHSPTPSYQGRKEVKICQYTGKQYTKDVEATESNTTNEQASELAEAAAIVNGGDGKFNAEYAEWETAEELYDLITKTPPAVQETMLVIAIMVYLLRILGAEFDPDTATFGTFFENWHKMIVRHY